MDMVFEGFVKVDVFVKYMIIISDGDLMLLFVGMFKVFVD